jgi:hypothetical protein
VLLITFIHTVIVIAFVGDSKDVDVGIEIYPLLKLYALLGTPNLSVVGDTPPINHTKIIIATIIISIPIKRIAGY